MIPPSLLKALFMRTGLFLLAGLLLLAGFFVLGKLFSQNFPSAMLVAAAGFVALWLTLTGFNMWVGVAKAGYSVSEELPVLLVLFGVPAAAAIGLKWKFF
jgi:hypothetical protein